MKKPLRLLIVDDDKDDLDLFSYVVHELDPHIDVFAFSNGSQAIDCLQRCGINELPQVAILDYNMPGLDGPALLEQLSRTQKFESILKFILSTGSNKLWVDQCRSNGAIEYFVKPNTIYELRVIAATIIAHASLFMENQKKEVS
jgi:CheY-like chemotaxis protein